MRISCCALLLVLLGAPLLAKADNYPSRPVSIVVPFTAGGPADTAARTFADVLQRHFSRPLVLENRPAASGITGTEAVALNGQDGYTLLLGGIAALALIPPVEPVRYVVARDFAPLGLIWRSPQVLAVRPALGISTVAEFVTYAKAHPGAVTVGSAGNGTITHLAGELLQREAGIKLLHVPYRSTANSLTDLMGGHIDAIFGDVAIVRPHAQSGAVKAIAVTSPERSPLLPDLPTMQEQGLRGVRTEVWYGLLASSRIPADALALLKTAVKSAQVDPELAERLKPYGVKPPNPGADSFAAFIHEEADRWAPIVKALKPN
jgi:tripartite-type tricarboxylate transporter receptor subunit TctC